MNLRSLGVSGLLLCVACRHAPPEATPAPASAAKPVAPIAGERHLGNVSQLTFGGQNAEAYFSPDGRELIFQRRGGGDEPCDQMYVMGADGSNPHRISNGTGVTTCGYFFPDAKRLLYASTHLASPECPPRPDHSHGYVWPLLDYSIFTANPDGTDLKRLTDAPGYNAEATISRDGQWIVFTSSRDGDLELYKMHLDGTGLVRLTHTPGYDGGAFFSPDGKRIVFRAARAKDEAEAADSLSLFKQHLVRPTRLEIYVMNADGSDVHAITKKGAASFAPYFLPDGHRIIYASNALNPKGPNFDLYLVNDDGTGDERVTFDNTFDSFPMFSPDGRKLVFASNRFAKTPHGETNIFIADWLE